MENTTICISLGDNDSSSFSKVTVVYRLNYMNIISAKVMESWKSGVIRKNLTLSTNKWKVVAEVDYNNAGFIKFVKRLIVESGSQ